MLRKRRQIERQADSGDPTSKGPNKYRPFPLSQSGRGVRPTTLAKPVPFAASNGRARLAVPRAPRCLWHGPFASSARSPTHAPCTERFGRRLAQVTFAGRQLTDPEPPHRRVPLYGAPGFPLSDRKDEPVTADRTRFHGVTIQVSLSAANAATLERPFRVNDGPDFCFAGGCPTRSACPITSSYELQMNAMYCARASPTSRSSGSVNSSRSRSITCRGIVDRSWRLAPRMWVRLMWVRERRKQEACGSLWKTARCAVFQELESGSHATVLPSGCYLRPSSTV